MGTIVVTALLTVGVGAAVRTIIRAKKNGKSMQCGGDCANCSRGCH